MIDDFIFCHFRPTYRLQLCSLRRSSDESSGDRWSERTSGNQGGLRGTRLLGLSEIANIEICTAQPTSALRTLLVTRGTTCLSLLLIQLGTLDPSTRSSKSALQSVNGQWKNATRFFLPSYPILSTRISRPTGIIVPFRALDIDMKKRNLSTHET